MKKIIGFLLILVVTVSLCETPVYADDPPNLGGLGGSVEAIEEQLGEDTDDPSEDGGDETSAPTDEGSESEETTTKKDTDNGGFEVNREFTDEELMRLYEIRQELEESKKANGNIAFSTVCSVAGIIIILYSVLILVAFILDKFNNFVDIDFVKILTFGHACTVKSDSDVGLVDSKLYIFTTKRMIINTCVGFVIGGLLMNSMKIIDMFYFVYDTLTGGGLG